VEGAGAGLAGDVAVLVFGQRRAGFAVGAGAGELGEDEGGEVAGVDVADGRAQAEEVVEVAPVDADGEALLEAERDVEEVDAHGGGL
jgi:hypothetical protein